MTYQSGIDMSWLAEIDVARYDRGEPLDASADPLAGGTLRNKPIFTPEQAGAQLTRSGLDWTHNNYGELDDGVLNYGFWSSYGQLANSYYVNTDGTIAFNEAFFADDFSIFTPGQIGLASKSIALWDDLIDISFQMTSANIGDLNFGNTNTGGAQAYAYLPFGDVYDYYYEYFGFEEVGRLGGDVWIDGFVASNFFPLDDGYYALTTMIHEIGHALGLSHPGDYNATDGVPLSYDLADYYQDSLQYSIMSYWDGYETGAQYIDWTLTNFAYPATPQVHDIVAIQAVYGADMTTRTDDTTYGFNSTADRDVFDFTYNTRPIVTIWDAGGNDTLDLSGYDTNSVIDLHQGAFSSASGIEEFLTLEEVNANRAALGFAPRTQEVFDFYEQLKADLGLTNGLYKDNIAIAYGATIENAVGGGGDDLIKPNEVANIIVGLGGIDTVSYADAGAAVIANLKTGGTGGEAAGDLYLGVENLTGSAFGDKLFGDNGDNHVDGGLGNDRITGNAGNDVLRGQEGNDTIEGGNGNDKLFGGEGADTLFGNRGADGLTGGGGADQFLFNVGDAGRNAGADTILDFLAGTDKINLLSIGANGGSYQIVGANVSQARVVIDSNGDGTLDMDIIVKLAGGPLSALDFLI